MTQFHRFRKHFRGPVPFLNLARAEYEEISRTEDEQNCGQEEHFLPCIDNRILETAKIFITNYHKITFDSH